MEARGRVGEGARERLDDGRLRPRGWHDFKGKQEGRHEQTLNVSSLSSGVYFLRLQAGGEIRTQKLTVVK